MIWANTLCSIVSNTIGKNRKTSISELVDRYQNHAPISPKQLGSIIDESVDPVKQHADYLAGLLKIFIAKMMVGSR